MGCNLSRNSDELIIFISNFINNASHEIFLYLTNYRNYNAILDFKAIYNLRTTHSSVHFLTAVDTRVDTFVNMIIKKNVK